MGSSLIPYLIIAFCALWNLLSLQLRRSVFSLQEQDLITGFSGPWGRIMRRSLSQPKRTSTVLWLSDRFSVIGIAVGGYLAWGEKLLLVLFIVPSLIVVVREVIHELWVKKSPQMSPKVMAWTMAAIDLSLGQAMSLFERLGEAIARVIPSVEVGPEKGAVEKEVIGLVEKGRHEGVLKTEEHELIHRVLEFGDREVSKIMTPRPDMFCIPAQTSVSEATKELAEAGYSRVPVYESTKDNIVGILFAKDLLGLKLCPKEQTDSASIRDLARPPFFIPLTMEVGDLLRELRKRRLHMALCVDEFGAVAGLVTLEDVLEELFGEIYDEYDLETRRWEHLGQETYLVTGKMSIHELEELMGVKIDHHGCNTVAGLMLRALGHFPAPGESASISGLVLEAERTDKTRILAIKVSKQRSTGN